MKVYEYVLVYRPKEGTVKVDGTNKPVILDSDRILAKDEKHAAMLAARSIPDDHADHLDEVDVLIRPF